jgi:hypothetical protein
VVSTSCILPVLLSPARRKFGRAGASSRNTLAEEGVAVSMFRNFLAGRGVAGSMSWRVLFLELLDLMRRERHFAHVFNAFVVRSGGCFL